MVTYFHPLLTEETKLPFYIKCIGGLKNQSHISRLDGFPDHQCILCVKGKGKLLIDKNEIYIGPNMGIYIPPFISHEYYAVEEPWETHFIAFSGYGVGSLLDTLGLKTYEVFEFDDIKFLDSIITNIYTTAKSTAPSSAFKCSAMLYSFLIEVKNSIREKSNTMENVKFRKVLEVTAYIETNYKMDLSIDDMAKVIDASPQYLCRLFSQYLSTRPFAYLTKVRIQKAKELLLSSKDINVGEICREVGYNDQSYFGSIFKKIEGVTPIEYRNMFSVI